MPTPHRTAVLFASAVVAAATAAAAHSPIPYFGPNRGAAAIIARQLDAATESIDVAAYQLSNPALVRPLTAAAQRGVRIRVILDPSAAAQQSHRFLYPLRNTLNIRVDRWEKLFHNKYAVIDARITIVGGYNWSQNAELRNAESGVILFDADVAAAFAADFDHHWQHSVPLGTPPAPPPYRPRNYPRLAPTTFHSHPTEPSPWHALQAL